MRKHELLRLVQHSFPCLPASRLEKVWAKNYQRNISQAWKHSICCNAILYVLSNQDLHDKKSHFIVITTDRHAELQIWEQDHQQIIKTTKGAPDFSNYASLIKRSWWSGNILTERRWTSSWMIIDWFMQSDSEFPTSDEDLYNHMTRWDWHYQDNDSWSCWIRQVSQRHVSISTFWNMESSGIQRKWTLLILMSNCESGHPFRSLKLWFFKEISRKTTTSMTTYARKKKSRRDATVGVHSESWRRTSSDWSATLSQFITGVFVTRYGCMNFSEYFWTISKGYFRNVVE